jgi:hypothetical protein
MRTALNGKYRGILLAFTALALVACERKTEIPPAAADSVLGANSSAFIRVDSLDTPESAVHDTIHDVYLVSNIRGDGLARDSNGFISRIRPDGSVEALRFIEGGRSGVTLHAPKGMALRGDSLWVSDIDVVRVFSATSGAPLGFVDLAPHGAMFLNDVATGPDGSLYITDTGFRLANGEYSHPGPDRLFRISPNRQVTILLTGDKLARPNGITWDQDSSRLLLAPLGDSAISTFRIGDSAPAELVKGPGGYDGIESLGQGRFVVSSLDASSILVFSNGALRTVIDSLTDPADIGVDRRRGRVLIPSLGGNRLEIRPLQP